MAEITVVETNKSVESTIPGRSPSRVHNKSIRVESINSDHPDLSVLHDLMKALDMAEAPRTARVELHDRNVGRSGAYVVVTWDLDVAAEPTPPLPADGTTTTPTA